MNISMTLSSSCIREKGFLFAHLKQQLLWHTTIIWNISGHYLAENTDIDSLVMTTEAYKAFFS